jgi:hypothetical protein
MTQTLFRMLLMLCAFFISLPIALAQERDEPGKPIGKVSAVGDLILMELDKDALGQQNLFDLGQRTLRFTPGKGGYRVDNIGLRWDADFGQELSTRKVTLHNFSFLFSGNSWTSFSVGVTGSIRFGGEGDSSAGRPGPGFGSGADQGGVSVGRFDRLSQGAARLVNTNPAICVFFKPRMSGKRYVKE